MKKSQENKIACFCKTGQRKIIACLNLRPLFAMDVFADQDSYYDKERISRPLGKAGTVEWQKSGNCGTDNLPITLFEIVLYFCKL